ncbi:MAG: ATP-binding protein [Desulfobacterales bacterium]|nr:ATP-binding protein [Desulfobacterales bacterium]
MRRFFKRIHIKIIFGALIPVLFVMGVITLLALVTIENTALEVVIKRDAELAEIAANRLSENLQKYPFLLQSLAAKDPLTAIDKDKAGVMANLTRNWLHIFDGGIYIYDIHGSVTWSYPEQNLMNTEQFPDGPGFKTILTSLRPYFSDIITTDSPAGNIIVIGVPIIGKDGECTGVIAGISSVNHSALGVTYTKVLEYKSGKRSYAFLVDGKGRALYHRHSSLIGSKMENRIPVEKVVAGETGAMIAENTSGKRVISGFAPVPGTGWGIVTQGNWSMIQDLVRFYTRLFLIILWAGGTLSGLLVFFLIQRLMRPVRELTRGAQQVANGKFIEIPVNPTGDEIEILSRQFNSMARATKSSFANINKRLHDLDKARRALKQSEEKISGIINAVNDAMLMVDDTGKIRWINDKGRKLFGRTAEESPYYEILYQQPAPPDDCIIRNCFTTGIENDTELKILNTGKFQDFWCTCSVVQHHRGGQVARVVVVCRNLTEKKRLRAEVLRNAQLAALGELAAGIAHEINNPINGIINYAQIIEDTGSPDTPHAQLPARIIKEGERIAIIVSKLLSFARSGTEKKEPLIFREVVDDVLDLTCALLKKENIIIEMDIPDDLPAARAVVHQIRQIFLNLISNARYALNEKYPDRDPDKKIIITCSAVENEEIPMVRTVVRDQGTGISKKIIEKICNPFFSTKPPDQGTGLGLSISYGIIEEHHGELDIQSVHGLWTEVVVDLPMWKS